MLKLCACLINGANCANDSGCLGNLDNVTLQVNHPVHPTVRVQGLQMADAAPRQERAFMDNLDRFKSCIQLFRRFCLPD